MYHQRAGMLECWNSQLHLKIRSAFLRSCANNVKHKCCVVLPSSPELLIAGDLGLESHPIRKQLQRNNKTEPGWTKELHMPRCWWDAGTSVCSLPPAECKTEPIRDGATIWGLRPHELLIYWHEWLHRSGRQWCKRASNATIKRA